MIDLERATTGATLTLDDKKQMTTDLEKQYDEIDAHVEASVHQVRIEVAPENLPDNPWRRRALEQRLVDRASHWARLCVTERHAGV